MKFPLSVAAIAMTALDQHAVNTSRSGVCLSNAADRRMGVIFGLSLLLHALVFALLTGQRSAPMPAMRPLLAALRPAVIESGAPAAVPLTLAPKVRQSSSPTSQRSALPVTRTAGPTSTLAPVAVAEAPVVSAAPPVSAVAPTVVATSALSSAGPTPAKASQGDLLAAYRSRLSQLFASQQDYPRIAVLRGWEGEVLLRLTVARKGNLVAVRLDRSSGFDVLDQSARAFVEAMAALPPLPEALEANEIQVVVPVHYKLRKNT